MTVKEKIIRRMVELAGSPDSEWTAVATRVGATIRRTWIEATPDYMRPATWAEESYQAHVFLTLVAGKFLLGRAPAPWVGRQDSYIPLWLAEAILEDPELGLDTGRQLEMRDARKAGRHQRPSLDGARS